MRALGRADGPFLVPSAGSGVPLRAGAVVSVRILSELGQGRYRVLAAGKELLASSLARLSQGSIYDARVENAHPGDPRLVLRLLPGLDERRASLLASQGLPDDALSRLALTALLSEGLRPARELLLRVRRAIKNVPEGEKAERASLAARFEAKGLGAEEKAVEIVGGFSDPGGRERGGAETDGHRGEKPPGKAPGVSLHADSTAFDLSGPLERSFSPEELIPALGAFVRALVERSAAPRDKEEELLGLFNHARGVEGGALLAPFRFELDSVAFDGSFRLQLPYMPGGPCRFEAHFTVSKAAAPETETWSFVLEPEGRGASKLLLRSGRVLLPAERDALYRSFESSAVRLHLEEPPSQARGRASGGKVDIDV